MNLHALKIFVTVANYKSITQAAKQLLISQPAVTIQIRNLEKELNLKLIEGKGRGIQLTQAGEYVYEQGRRLFHLEKNIELKINEFKQQNEQLKIASTYLPSNFILPKILAQYKLENPSIFINVSVGNVENVERKILDYEADVGIVVRSDIGHEDLIYEKIMTLPFWFIVPTNHRFANKTITLQEITKEPMILREQGSSTRDLLYAICYANNCPKPPIGIQLQGLHESIKAVQAGYGTMLAPSISVEDYILSGKVARVFIEGINVFHNIYICYRKIELEQTPFIQFMKNKLDCHSSIDTKLYT